MADDDISVRAHQNHTPPLVLCPLNFSLNPGLSCILKSGGGAIGKPNHTLVLGAQEREQLEALTRSRSMRHSSVRRARAAVAQPAVRIAGAQPRRALL
jgi:hypothetical protein